MKRSIADDEVALIKAMAARGMPTHAIQFRFNRPDRRVNSGRITDIKAGRYGSGSSATIAPAPDEVLDAFLAHPPGPMQESPTCETALQRLFKRERNGRWRLMEGETDRVECKANFSLRGMSAWLRPIAGLANNRGGYVLFGVADKDATGACWVTGMDKGDFAAIDPVEITKRVRATFDPTPTVTKTTLELGAALVGVLHVERHPSRPVMATRNEGEGVREGDVLYRYTAQTTRIKYADLRAMLDARDQEARKAVLPLVERLLELDPARVMLADLKEGNLTDGRGRIEIDEALLERIKWIREGEFKEREGAPALRLVGDVMVAGAATTRKGVLDTNDVLSAFLSGSLEADPMDYLRHVIEVGDTGWFPVHHFAVAAGLDLAGLRDFVRGSKAGTARKAQYHRKLSSTDQAHKRAGGSTLEVLGRLLSGEIAQPADAREAGAIGMAMQGLARPLAIAPARARALLTACVTATVGEANRTYRTPVRKAIARLDELLSPEDYADATPASSRSDVVVEDADLRPASDEVPLAHTASSLRGR